MLTDTSKNSSVQLLCCSFFVTPWTAARQASLCITNSRSWLKLMSIELVMPSNHLIFCCPLLLPPSSFPSIRVFSNESVLHIRWPKYWSFSFSISPSNEYSGLISFRMDWLNLLLTQIPPNQKTQKEQKLRWALRAKERAFYWPRQPEKEAQWDISWEKQKSNPSFCPEEKHGVLSGGLTAKWNQEHRHL